MNQQLEAIEMLPYEKFFDTKLTSSVFYHNYFVAIFIGLKKPKKVIL